jgi:hypothetical protein
MLCTPPPVLLWRPGHTFQPGTLLSSPAARWSPVASSPPSRVLAGRVQAPWFSHALNLVLKRWTIPFSVFTENVLSPKRKRVGDIIAIPQIVLPSTDERLSPNNNPLPSGPAFSHCRKTEQLSNRVPIYLRAKKMPRPEREDEGGQDQEETLDYVVEPAVENDEDEVGPRGTLEEA